MIKNRRKKNKIQVVHLEYYDPQNDTEKVSHIQMEDQDEGVRKLIECYAKMLDPDGRCVKNGHIQMGII